MTTRTRRAFSAAAAALLATTLPAAAAGPASPPRPTPNRADEPAAGAYSPRKAAAFLDGVAVHWTRDRNCGTCHTNYPFLLARTALRGTPAEGEAEVRRFFEERVAHWDRGRKGDAPRWDTEVVATAATLALHDARTTGKLHPLTRSALDRAWTLQKPDGAWNWLKCDWPPMEHDDYFGAVYAALGVGHAPDGYAATPKARAGLDRLRAYFRANPPPDLHHKAMLLWASGRVEGLMTGAERESAVKELLAAQHADGGWSLPSLGAWKRRDGTANDHAAPSDGYGTGFAVYVLRQAGLPADHGQVRAGADWLRKNQRASGRWFTRSLSTDHNHFITHAGTAFAVLALEACEGERAAGD